MHLFPSPSRCKMRDGTGTDLQGRSHQFATLDGLRGIAALAVMTWHFRFGLGTVLLPHSYLAVDFFFILSGFVLAHAYEARLLQGMTPARFLHVRLARLYPLYLIGTLIGIASTTAFGAIDWSRSKTAPFVLLALLFLPDLKFHSMAYPFNSPAWSLFFELMVNAAYAIAILRFTNRTLIIIAFLSLAILVACYSNLFDVGSTGAHFIGGFPRVSFGFFAGVLTYRIWSTAKWRPLLPQWATQGTAVALLLIFAASQSSPWGDRFDFTALLVFPLIVYCGACCEPSLRSRSICLWLGSISYALYIIHSPLQVSAEHVAQYFFRIPLSAATPWAGLGLAATAVVLAAVFSSIDPTLRRALMARRKVAVSPVATKPMSST
jgi:peptidoglycan/LPS O-acetylase OafA/YrhL